MFSKFKIFKTVDLLRMVLKAMLENSDRRTTFVNGVDQVSARNREKKEEEDALSDMNNTPVPSLSFLPLSCSLASVVAVAAFLARGRAAACMAKLAKTLACQSFPPRPL
jgi:hypothetical protein